MKGKRTDLGTADCAIARSLQVIGDWWSLLIVRESFLGRQRFGEFQKSLGLAKNILSTRLKKLVQEGILSVEAESPTRNRYVLTEKGRRLYVVLIALWQWGEDTCFDGDELSSAMVDGEARLPLAKLEPRARDGRPVGPSDFVLARKADIGFRHDALPTDRDRTG
ncbi:helix-turn-helix domain-containing protein [Beijerinckia sp. L45]|uniref:winged helix-turn-helix transcriptional regulator n=1 Tax=Beijerinckia sp. L45 TaxID=1641855 RepID=UPI00131EB272|nr:helix-turn-helix domain-containing protein [Beijerinckia sp. L45]